MGSLFGYVQQDTLARFHRMRGEEVFYPMGWDDNGVPTERRVQNYFGVRCDPSLPYDAEFTPPTTPPDRPIPISRPNFVELCARLTVEDEQAFENLWRHLGLSVDWTMTYTTIGDRSRRVSQRAFLRNLARGEAYQMEAPTLWDVDFEMAVSQADLEDRDQKGAYHRIHFGGPAWERLQGNTVAKARKEIVELLRESGELLDEPRPITHPVKFYERGDRPLEIVTSRQWFIRTMEMRDTLFARGRELRWHPPHMRTRYEDWVNGLSGDWLVSRQRFFGVPFPIWYPVTDDSEVDYGNPIRAPEDQLPVDPSSDVPAGFSAEQRAQPNGFAADPDIMDTWATSSLTPQIACGWQDDPDLFARTYPMNLRPQGPEIIRTWLFYTIVRAEAEHGLLPWSDTTINGWVLDPDRKKMSKSKGNVVTPLDLLEQHGSDALRYWAASGRPGTDTALDDNQFRIGRRLAIKLLNASKFVLSRLGDEGQVTAALDRAMLRRLAGLVGDATNAFGNYDYARALERTEAFFWSFCDDYLELVKGRAYGTQGTEGAASANRALTLALSTLLRLFAPFLPYVTEEVWSWWQQGSVHRASWPTAAELGDGGDPLVLDTAAAVLAEVRKAKTEAKQSLRAEVSRVVVRDSPERLAALAAAEADVREAGHIADLVTEAADALAVSVELAVI